MAKLFLSLYRFIPSKKTKSAWGINADTRHCCLNFLAICILLTAKGLPPLKISSNIKLSQIKNTTISLLFVRLLVFTDMITVCLVFFACFVFFDSILIVSWFLLKWSPDQSSGASIVCVSLFEAQWF